MKRFRLLTAVFVSCCLLASLAACNAGTPATPGTQSGDNAPVITAPAGGEPYGGLAPLPNAGDPIEFSIFVRDPGMMPDTDNPVIQKIAELTGVRLHFEFLVGDLDQKLRVMIAGSDYPDAIYAGDSAQGLIQAGAFINLEDKIPNYPNLHKLYGQVMPAMKHADGHVYTLELFGTFDGGATAPAPQFESDAGFYIQKAVLEEFGFPEVRTVEDYFALIEAYMARHPMIEGTQTIGFDILNDGWRKWSLMFPVQYLLGADNSSLLYVNPDTLKTSFYQTGDTAYRYYKTLNQSYRNDLIAPQALTQSYEQYLYQISTGAVLGFFDQSWNFESAQNLLKADGKFARTYVSLPLMDEGVRGGRIGRAAGIPTGINGIGITVNCKDPERLLLLYDWLLQREVQDYLQWGVRDTDWTDTEDGGKVLTPQRRAVLYDDAQKRDLTGYLVWYYAPKWQGIYTADNVPAGYEESAAEYEAALSDYDRDFLEHYGCQYPAQLHDEAKGRTLHYPLSAMGMEEGSPAHISESQIEDLLLRYYPRLILAASDDAYDATWREFTAEFNSIDLAAYQDEVERQLMAAR